MTIDKTNPSATSVTVANKNNSIESNKISAKSRSHATDIKSQDALSFLQSIHNNEGVLPLGFTQFNAFNVSDTDIAVETAYGSSGTSSPLSGQAAEDPSATFLCNTIIQKLLRNPALQNMTFSIENKHGRVDIEAAINSGHMRCALSTSNDKLKRRLMGGRQQIISSLGNHLRKQIELDIEE